MPHDSLVASIVQALVPRFNPSRFSSIVIYPTTSPLSPNIFPTTLLTARSGVGSNIEVLAAETALKDSQTNYYNALFDALIAKIDFDKANGSLK